MPNQEQQPPCAYLPCRNPTEVAILGDILKEYSEAKGTPMDAKFHAVVFWRRLANDQTAAILADQADELERLRALVGDGPAEDEEG